MHLIVTWFSRIILYFNCIIEAIFSRIIPYFCCIIDFFQPHNDAHIKLSWSWSHIILMKRVFNPVNICRNLKIYLPVPICWICSNNIKRTKTSIGHNILTTRTLIFELFHIYLWWRKYIELITLVIIVGYIYNDNFNLELSINIFRLSEKWIAFCSMQHNFSQK